jgi:LysM repeat protein
MDTTLSDNRSSNLLVYAVLIAAIIALVLGIASLVQISKVKKQLGDVDVAGLTARVDATEAKANTASTDARSANNNVRNLQTAMEREIGTQLTDIRSNIARVEDLAKQASDKAANLGSRPVRSAETGTGSAGPTAGPTTTATAEDGTYVIKGGDTLAKVAAQFGISTAELQAANPGVEPRKLHVGQKIVVPKK